MQKLGKFRISSKFNWQKIFTVKWEISKVCIWIFARKIYNYISKKQIIVSLNFHAKSVWFFVIFEKLISVTINFYAKNCQNSTIFNFALLTQNLENSNYLGKTGIQKHRFLAEKFKFTFFNFYEDWILWDILRVSYSLDFLAFQF